MKKILAFHLFLFFLILLGKPAFAAGQVFTIKRLDPDAGISQVSYNNQGFSYPSEVTPLSFLQNNGSSIYVLSTAWTWMCVTTNTILFNNLSLLPSDCKLILKHELLDNVVSGTPVWVNGLWNSSTTPWKRGYDGMLGFSVINTSMGKRIVGIRHGEHFNARLGYNLYQNQIYTNFSVNPNFNVWNCSTGYQANGSYEQCWDSFAGFANLAWATYSPISFGSDIPNFVDEGPVLWPSQAYIRADGQRSGAGFFHPTMFVSGGYIYLFTINSLPDTPGDQCMIASRSPESQGGIPGTWKNYYNGLFSENALPAGFSKEQIQNYYHTPGGKADCVFGNTSNRSRNHIYFNVAKVRNTPYFLGAVVENTPDPDGNGPLTAFWHLRFVVSSDQDLIQWIPVKNCLASGFCYDGDHWTEAGGWGYGILEYPVFYNKDGASNDEIDADEFYVLGTHATGNASGYELNKLRLSFSFPQISATPTPTPVPPTLTPFPTSTPTPTVTTIPPSPTLTSVPPTVTPTPIPGDITGPLVFGVPDGKVDIYDYNLLIRDFGKSGSPADIDGNGIVNIFDYNTLIGNFGMPR